MNKKLLSTLSLLFVVFIANAQITYTISTDSAYLNLADNNILQKAKITLTNGPTATTFEWRIVQVDIPSDWVAPGVCDWEYCYFFEDPSWHAAYLAPNATHDLYVEMKRPNGASQGCAQVGIEYGELAVDTAYQVLRHASGPNLASCTALWPTATSDISNNSVVAVYPNPTTNIINLDIINIDVTEVILSNIIGAQIQRLDVTNSTSSKHQFSMQELPQGIYTLQFKSENGKVLGVKRITKQ